VTGGRFEGAQGVESGKAVFLGHFARGFLHLEAGKGV
jgi:hypothetical protein